MSIYEDFHVFGILDALEKAGAHKEERRIIRMSCGCSASFPCGNKVDGLPHAPSVEFRIARRTCFIEQYYTGTRRYYVGKGDGEQY